MWQRLDNRGLLPQTSDEGSVGQGARSESSRDQRAVLTPCKIRNDEQNVDLYSPFIVGWAVSAVNDRALEMALKRAEAAVSRGWVAASFRPGLHIRQRGLSTNARRPRHHVQHHCFCNANYRRNAHGTRDDQRHFSANEFAERI